LDEGNVNKKCVSNLGIKITWTRKFAKVRKKWENIHKD
jgi:hypothetical protein